MAKIGEAKIKIVPSLGDPGERVELRVYEHEMDTWADENGGADVLAKNRKELAQVLEQTIPEVSVVLTEELPRVRGIKPSYRFHVYYVADTFPESLVHNVVYSFLRVKIMEAKVEFAESEVEALNADKSGWQDHLERLNPTKDA